MAQPLPRNGQQTQEVKIDNALPQRPWAYGCKHTDSLTHSTFFPQELRDANCRPLILYSFRFEGYLFIIIAHGRAYASGLVIKVVCCTVLTHHAQNTGIEP